MPEIDVWRHWLEDSTPFDGIKDWWWWTIFYIYIYKRWLAHWSLWKVFILGGKSKKAKSELENKSLTEVLGGKEGKQHLHFYQLVVIQVNLCIKVVAIIPMNSFHTILLQHHPTVIRVRVVITVMDMQVHFHVCKWDVFRKK